MAEYMRYRYSGEDGTDGGSKKRERDQHGKYSKPTKQGSIQTGMATRKVTRTHTSSECTMRICKDALLDIVKSREDLETHTESK